MCPNLAFSFLKSESFKSNSISPEISFSMKFFLTSSPNLHSLAKYSATSSFVDSNVIESFI